MRAYMSPLPECYIWPVQVADRRLQAALTKQRSGAGQESPQVHMFRPVLTCQPEYDLCKLHLNTIEFHEEAGTSWVANTGQVIEVALRVLYLLDTSWKASFPWQPAHHRRGVQAASKSPALQWSSPMAALRFSVFPQRSSIH